MATEIIVFIIMGGTAQAGIGAGTPPVTGMDGVARQVTTVGRALMADPAEAMECTMVDTIMAGPKGDRRNISEIARAAPATAAPQRGMVVVDMTLVDMALVDMAALQRGMGADLVATAARTTNRGQWTAETAATVTVI